MRELSNLSYTNKDFNSIYTELLEYAKKLSYRWDPTSSDESDPGVVLLKLAALIGDKDNYNIDKNVLELMPASVTQMPAARQLFDQCGYTMRYYTAAEGYVNLTIKSDLGDPLTNKSKDVAPDDTEYTYRIPMFTMFTDTDNSVVYTSVQDVSAYLKTPCSVRVMEGTITNYTVNNDPLITMQNLDSNNRLYFTETNIAENGIFITNVGKEANYEDWERVDNLQTQPKGKSCYKFGLTVDNSICYIEFPDDIENFIGEGLNISYILTSGSTGNISVGKLREFYVDIKFEKKAIDYDSAYVDATTENIYIRNNLPIMGGNDPESIDNAYKNYQRVRDTFETLVSIKDYSDYLVSSKTASNGFVCDRTNDIQHSYKVVKSDNAATYVTTVFEQVEENDVMTAFDLCVYALQYQPSITTTDLFNDTFKLFDITKDRNKIKFADEVKSLQHNYKEFDSEKILLIKNKYIIKTNVVPRYPLSTSEKYEVTENIEQALCAALNSSCMSFGEPPSNEVIQDTIIYADERIKTLIDFNSLEYSTYAVYKDTNDTIKEVRIDEGYDITKDDKLTAEKKPIIETFRKEVFCKNVLAGVTPLYNPDTTYAITADQTSVVEYKDITKISTNTKITFEKDGSSYSCGKLRKNENLLLTAPNFIEENNFSSYVKVLYNIPKDTRIDAESKYQLRGDDYFIFFYKAADTDDDYTYIKYDSSDNSPAKYISLKGFNITKPQDLTSSKHNTNDNVVKNSSSVFTHFATKLSAGKGKTSSKNISTLDITETQFVKEYLVSESNNQVLTGTKIISTFNINTIHINNETNGCSNVYWILNNDDNKLFETTTKDSNQSSYVLDSGEYFLYTNDEQTQINILGEGTLLEIKGFNGQKWSIKEHITYEQLLFEGIDILSGKWFTIPKSDENKLTATEQERILIGPGNIVKLNLTYTGTKQTPPDPVVDKGGVTSNYNVTSASYGPKYGTENKIPILNSTDHSWNIVSLLNFNASSTVPQRIEEGQTVTITHGDSSTKIEGSSKEANNKKTYTPTFILTNKPVQMVGNIDLNVKDYELSMLTYQSSDANVNGSILQYVDTLAVQLEANKEKEIKLELLEGNYIIQFYSDVDFSVKIGNNDFIKSTNNSVVGNIYLNKQDTITITLKSEKDTDVTIPPLFKYTEMNIPKCLQDTSTDSGNKEAASETIETTIENMIKDLGSSHGFNYTYQPKDTIQNPLEATSFLRHNHFYNPYTICQWNTSSIDNVSVRDVVR